MAVLYRVEADAIPRHVAPVTFAQLWPIAVLFACPPAEMLDPLLA